MFKQYDLSGKTVLITGAGSGIGRSIAVLLSTKGCRLILTDINEMGLKETEGLCLGTVDLSLKLDVGDRESIHQAYKTISMQLNSLDILINNAGVALGGTFDQVSEEDFDWLFQINFQGVVRMCRTFLPMLRKSPAAHIVNISSVFGIIAPAGMVAYSASKFAVRGFSLALGHELEDTNIGVTCVHPGGVATSIAKSARVPKDIDIEQVRKSREAFEKHLLMKPERAAKLILRAVEKRKKRVIIGGDGLLLLLIEWLLPTGYWKVIKSQFPT